MLDCARVLLERNNHITGSAIFLFNGAEGKPFRLSCGLQLTQNPAETLQDASHLYSTQHETKDLYVSRVLSKLLPTKPSSV